MNEKPIRCPMCGVESIQAGEFDRVAAPSNPADMIQLPIAPAGKAWVMTPVLVSAETARCLQNIEAQYRRVADELRLKGDMSNLGTAKP